MSSTFAIFEHAQRRLRISRGATRAVLTATGVVGVLFASTHTAEAQTSLQQPATWEILVPSGAQRGVLKGAAMSAVQVSYVLRPSFALTTTFEWARSRDLATAGDPQLDAFTFSLGAEARAPKWFEGQVVTFSPFAGVGAGVRSYNYRKLDVGVTHNLASYAAVGGDLGIRRVHLRLEVRDYVTGFKPLIGGGEAEPRNDVVFMVGLRFTRRSS